LGRRTHGLGAAVSTLKGVHGGKDGNPTELGRSTIIVRTADHGEMGMAHGGQRQKAFNTYEESLRVPLVFSNPVLFPKRYETDNLASLIDLMPTFADLANVKPVDGLMGHSLAPILHNPENAPAVQEQIVFTYDDVRAGNPNASPVNAADRIRCIRETKWKYARYFHAKGSYPEEWEMYDLASDPGERTKGRARRTRRPLHALPHATHVLRHARQRQTSIRQYSKVCLVECASSQPCREFRRPSVCDGCDVSLDRVDVHGCASPAQGTVGLRSLRT